MDDNEEIDIVGEDQGAYEYAGDDIDTGGGQKSVGDYVCGWICCVLLIIFSGPILLGSSAVVTYIAFDNPRERLINTFQQAVQVWASDCPSCRSNFALQNFTAEVSYEHCGWNATAVRKFQASDFFTDDFGSEEGELASYKFLQFRTTFTVREACSHLITVKDDFGDVVGRIQGGRVDRQISLSASQLGCQTSPSSGSGNSHQKRQQRRSEMQQLLWRLPGRSTGIPMLLGSRPSYSPIGLKRRSRRRKPSITSRSGKAGNSIQKCQRICTSKDGTYSSASSISSFRCQVTRYVQEYCMKVSSDDGGFRYDTVMPLSGQGCYYLDGKLDVLELSETYYPDNMPLFIRSSRDPYLKFLALSEGSKNFGFTQGEYFSIAALLFVLGLISTACCICTCCCLYKFMCGRQKHQPPPQNPVGSFYYGLANKVGKPFGVVPGYPAQGYSNSYNPYYQPPAEGYQPPQYAPPSSYAGPGANPSAPPAPGPYYPPGQAHQWQPPQIYGSAPYGTSGGQGPKSYPTI